MTDLDTARLLLRSPIARSPIARLPEAGTQAGSFGVVIDLGDLDGANGFKIQGEVAGDFAGRSVASAGDINGDGFTDLIVGASANQSGGGINTGAAYVIFGKANASALVALGAPLAAADGFKIQGDRAGDYAGSSVAAAGDVNGDGFDDIIVGAFGNDGPRFGAGAAYVLFGKPGGFGPVDLGQPIEPDDGFKIQGDGTADRLGLVASAGDFNGDGFADVILGALGNNGGGTDFGAAYVIFGKQSGFGFVNLGVILPPEIGFKIQGAATRDYAGSSVSSAGDINGDGFDDVIVAAPGNDDGNDDAGAAYVLFGKAAQIGIVDLAEPLLGSDGFKIVGAAGGSGGGIEVASAGDVNNDGLGDIIVGTSGDDDGGDRSGAAYVLFGRLGGFGVVDLDTPLAATDGFKIRGAAPIDLTGRTVASAGDVNGDGFADVIVGAERNDSGGIDAGAAYVLFGKLAGFGVIDLGAPLASTDGFKIQGEAADDFAGISVASAGDTSGDGFADLIVGAPFNDSGGRFAGAAYVILGRASFEGTAPPVIVSNGGGASAGLAIAENRAAVTTVVAVDADAGTVVAYSISSGADAAAFAIDTGTGALSFVAAPDFEAPADADADNVYDVTVRASDGSLFDEQVLAVTITDVNEMTGPPPPGFPAILDLGTLSDVDGFKIQGAMAQDFSGYSVSSAGDINGDGFDDVIVGARGNDERGSYSGMAYVLFGKPGGLGFVDLAAPLAASDGFRIRGEVSGAFAGVSVAAAGDVNGDGIGDLIVGQDGNDTEDSRSGSAFVLFGATEGLGFVDLRFPPDAAQGFTIQGERPNDDAGNSVASAGDVNGDGFDDLIIGAPANEDSDTDYNAGAAYVVFGRADGPGIVNLEGLDSSSGFKMQGDAGSDAAGYSVAGIGDINGDGFADIIVGAYGNNSDGANAGTAYVLFGKADRFELVNLGDPIDVASGFKIIGEAFGDYAGISVAGAGDVNGDGLADLILGAERNDNAGGGAAGAAYVLFGKTSGFGTVDLGEPIAATNGFKIEGGANSDFAGNSVAGAGDVNGDGFDDLIVGALFEDGGGYAAGAAYVLFGKASGFGTIALGALDLADGFKIQGEVARDYAGHSVAGAGDVNSDGFADLIVGAYRNDSGGERAGAAYVIFGRSTLPPGGPPVIGSDGGGSTAAIAVPENGTAVTTVVATDPDPGTTITYSISGGADANEFVVDAANGALRFRLAPNFERPGDSGLDNVYDVVVRASDGAQFDEQAIAVTVADIGEPVVPPPPPGFPAVLDLRTLSAADGFKIQGDAAQDAAGYSVASAGDVNGDGFADIIVGAYGNEGSSVEAGAAYVLFGKSGGFGFVDLGAPLSAAAGFKIEGELPGDNVGISVASAGDLNGDGFADIVVGAANSDAAGGADAGAAYVLFGKAGGFGTVSLAAPLAPAVGFKIQGEAGLDLAGNRVASAGDVNGDGLADLIVGARLNDSDGVDAGAAYVLFGKIGGFGFVDLAVPIAPTNGFKIQGRSDDALGSSVASAGDINGDGFDEVIVGAYSNDVTGNNAGAAYVIFGKASGFATIDFGLPVASSVGFRIRGAATADFTGESAATAGDFNGDGLDDLIVGARLNDGGGYASGAAYVLYGKTSGFGPVDLGAPLAATSGFKILGDAAGDQAGVGVASAGDVNGDGFDDVIVGAQSDDGGGIEAGAAYVLFGNADGVALVDLGVPLAPGVGFKIVGEASGDRAGFSVASAGDINGDGFDDMIVGAFANDSGGTSAGAAYVIFGQALGVPPVIVSDGGGATAAIVVAEGGTAVTTIAATDADPGTTIAYALSGGTDAARFSIDAATGVLSFVTPPDFEAPSDGGTDNVYEVTVRAGDGRLFDEQAISVTVSNINETPSSLVLTGDSVVENAAGGTVVGVVTGLDPDAGDVLRYTLLDSANGRFELDPDTGVLRVAAGVSLDFETTTSLQIIARVTDAGGLSVDASFLIQLRDVDDNPPVVVSVASTRPTIEGTAPGPVQFLTYELLRSGDISGTTRVSYSVSSASADAGDLVAGFSDGSVDFAPGQNTATISLAVVGDADVEANEQVTIVLNDALNGAIGLDDRGTAEIIDDDSGPSNGAPVIVSDGGGASAAVTLLEATTAVTTVTAVDPDAGTAIVYSIGGGTDAARFVIDAATGVLRFVAAPDFETPGDKGADNIYAVDVRASDGTLFDDQSIAVKVLNANEAPNDLALSNTGVAENSSGGTIVGTVTGLDPDLGDTLAYTLVDDAGGSFTLDADTGLLTVAAGALLDFETTPSRGIVVRVTDAAGLSFEDAFAIALTDVIEGGANSFTGTNDADSFVAAAGFAWTILGLGGPDMLTGAEQDDVIVGGKGPDILSGLAGNDIFRVGVTEGFDSFAGGADFDTIVATAPDVVIGIAAISGIERIEGEAAKIAGTELADTLDFSGVTLAGIVEIRGENGADVIIGSAGNDTILGGAGDDVLDGGDGDDRLTSGTGLDVLTGGDGADVFAGRAYQLRGDTILDFAEDDSIDIANFNNPAAVVLSYDGNRLFIDGDGSGNRPNVALIIGAGYETAMFNATVSSTGGTVITFEYG